MIYCAPAGSAFAPVAGTPAERESTPTFSVSVPASANPPQENFGATISGDRSELKTVTVQSVEQFDWDKNETKRDYIRLEQKVLANQSTTVEVARYKIMKRDRNGIIFADRYLADYAEIQRVQILARKIAELQEYLRPIKIG